MINSFCALILSMKTYTGFKRLLLILAIVLLLLSMLYLFVGNESLTVTPASRAALPGEFIELSQDFTHYELSGEAGAPLVVLVHGFSVPYYVWDPTAAALSAAGFRVLRYDWYGRGYSDRPGGSYDAEMYITQLRELTSALVPGKSFHLVGLSLGAPFSAAFANLYPASVRSLTLISPEVLPVSPAAIFPMNLPVLGEFVMKCYMVPFYLPQSQIKDAYNPASLPNWEAQYRPQLAYKGTRRALLATIRSLPATNFLREYERIGNSSLPVQIIWGQQDQSVSRDAVEAARQAMPRAHYLEVKDAAHLPHYEQPALVNAALIEFIESGD